MNKYIIRQYGRILFVQSFDKEETIFTTRREKAKEFTDEDDVRNIIVYLKIKYNIIFDSQTIYPKTV